MGREMTNSYSRKLCGGCAHYLRKTQEITRREKYLEFYNE